MAAISAAIAAGRLAERRLVEESPRPVADHGRIRRGERRRRGRRRPGRLRLDHAECGAGRDAPLGVVGLVGAHRQEEQRQSGAERGRHRVVAAVVHDHAGALEDPGLGQIAADADVAGDLAQGFARDPVPEGDDDVVRLAREGIRDQPEERDVAVHDGPQGHVDQGTSAQVVEPRRAARHHRRTARAEC